MLIYCVLYNTFKESIVSNNYKVFRMGFNYKLAEEIISCFNSDDPTYELDIFTRPEWSNAKEFIQEIYKDNKLAALKPQKHTLLHTFCEYFLYYYLMHERWFLLHEICDELDARTIINNLDRIAKILDEYGVTYRDYDNEIYLFEKKFEESDFTLDEKYKALVTEIFDEMIAGFNKMESAIVDATFYLLYDNKEFLFKFNKFISEFTNDTFLPVDYFDEYNHIKREKYLPEWLRRAVLYRDRGRCQHCGKDLSGLLIISNDRNVQFDHIIPLESGGTNDATNFQLLCNECNAKKGGQVISPNYFYQMYW